MHVCISGICSDIATSKYEYWSSLAPLPFEIVLSAGQKAKEESWEKGKQSLSHVSKLSVVITFYNFECHFSLLDIYLLAMKTSDQILRRTKRGASSFKI